MPRRSARANAAEKKNTQLVSVQGIPAESGFRGLCGRSRVHDSAHCGWGEPVSTRARIQDISNDWRPAASASHSDFESSDHLLYFPTEYYDYDVFAVYTMIWVILLKQWTEYIFKI